MSGVCFAGCGALAGAVQAYLLRRTAAAFVVRLVLAGAALTAAAISGKLGWGLAGWTAGFVLAVYRRAA